MEFRYGTCRLAMRRESRASRNHASAPGRSTAPTQLMSRCNLKQISSAHVCVATKVGSSSVQKHMRMLQSPHANKTNATAFQS
eukprot:2817464-Amphidinium_carterae.1